MGIMVSKDTQHSSEMNRRISSDLRNRAELAQEYDDEYDDGYDDDRNTKKTSRFGWVWILLIILAVISLICIIAI